MPKNHRTTTSPLNACSDHLTGGSVAPCALRRQGNSTWPHFVLQANYFDGIPAFMGRAQFYDFDNDGVSNSES
jgi:hypothetical protein